MEETHYTALLLSGGQEQGNQNLPKELMPPPSKFKQWQWWLLVFLNIIFVLVGQTVSTLLNRFYYDKGGNSKWLSTLVQTAAFPLLLLPLVFLPTTSSSSVTRPLKLALIYVALGLPNTVDNLMFSYGLLYLPVSTYSLICASQLAFNAVFAYCLNSQTFTPPLLNSVVLLSFSSALLGVDKESSVDSPNVPGETYVLGFILTLGASATYSLILSLMQLTFEKFIKTETYTVVLEMQLYPSLVGTFASLIGLYAGGEWGELGGEYEEFSKGKASYVMTVVGIAVARQVSSVGVVSLIFIVSSLFSNAISTLALPLIPVFAVIFFKDKMNGVKVLAMLLAIWGFLSYLYQNYLDDLEPGRSLKDGSETADSLLLDAETASDVAGT
ncbi:probable purine permease 11 [Phalaenopsis equestris]|uniref:probable purine permease 11 n=1 Tax=Phalaenopsis equestris TaxID=78828 RepID=UPI0009E3F6E8|nr:probable purine permease 11 [Phalaenopsis equestris]